MPSWLSETVASGDSILPLDVSVARLMVAMIFGFLVAEIYRATLGKRAEANSLPVTLALLSVLIALVTMVIGNSVARAFGLVGALSIVRFRTVVDDTRDTAFVIFAVVVGMAAGAGYALLATLGIPIVTVATLIMCRLDRWKTEALVADSRRGNGVHGSAAASLARVQVRLALGYDPELMVTPNLALHATGAPRLVAVSTVRQGSALELEYELAMRPDASIATLAAALNRVEGVQGIEVHS